MDGKALIDQQKKTSLQIAPDGIALDAKNGYLYYHALTAHTLYRIKTSFLTDEKLGKSELESKVENVGQTPAPDGMLEGTMVAFILPILNTAQSCVGIPRAGGSSKLLRTNVCSGNDIDHNRCEHNPKASAFERNFMRIRSDHGCDVTTAATGLAFFKIILSLDACCHAPT
ncbi:MAG TPA: hypothetical protein VGY75_10370 [Candidatus Udaeobacter sp.]|nr:hypothetical protein [Candidatus Udaeobacter sp.]